MKLQETNGIVLRFHVKRLAKDVLILAALGNMPDSFWTTDSRIGRAARALGWKRRDARAWARARANQIKARRRP